MIVDESSRGDLAIIEEEQEEKRDEIKTITENNILHYEYIPLSHQRTNKNEKRKVRFVVLSDTHLCQDVFLQPLSNNNRKSLDSIDSIKNEDIFLPKGDYLIHTGDFTNWGLPNEIHQFNKFLGKIKHLFKAIIVIPGNHEFVADLASTLLTNCTYFLKNDFIQLEDGKITIFGSRFKSFWSNFSFTGHDSEAQQDWSTLVKPIESGKYGKVDILLTHQPPDFKSEISKRFFRRGSSSLREAVLKVKPTVHVFGHNHDIFGVKYASDFCNDLNTTFISACTVDSRENVRKAVVFDYDIEE
ncbi:hypothetical protein ABK040_010318 [Willaertia magna]